MSALREILGNSQYWGLTLSIGAYLFACWLKQKTKLAFLNPILVSVIVIIVFLLGVGIDYDTYNKGASYLSWLLTPATVGILECANELKAVLIPFLIIIAVSTVVVMIVTGKVAQFMMESAEKKKEK